MGYPAAYRSQIARDLSGGAGARRSGFQEPPPAANDNVKRTPPPKPANDNNPSRSRSVATLGRSLRWAQAAHGLERLLRLSELNPSFHVAHDIFNLWRGRIGDQLPVTGLKPGIYGMPSAHGWFIEGGPCDAAGAISHWLGRNDPYQCVVTLTLTTAIYNSQLNTPTRSALGIYRVEGVANGRFVGASNWQGELNVKWRTVSGLAAGLYPAATFATYVKPGIVIQPVEIPFPQLDPMQLPVARPVTQPRPLPRPARVMPPNPFRSPHEQPQRGPQPASRAAPAPISRGTITVIEPGVRPATRALPPRANKPPEKGKKEVKLKTGAAGLIAKIVNAATESADLIDAIYKGLPRKIRGKAYWAGEATTPIERAKLIYENFDKIEWGRAVYEIVANQLEDRAFGRLGRIGAKANQARSQFSMSTGGGPNIGVGLGTGPVH